MTLELSASDKSSALLSPDESTASKLMREAYVFGGGTVVGVSSAVVDKCVNPLHTLGEAGTAYGLGLGLGYLQRRVPGMKVLGAALTYAFVKDIALRGESLGGIWSDTWQSSANIDANFKGVQKTLGNFIVDTTFSSVCGGLGASRGAGIGQRRDIWTDLEKRGFDNTSIGTVRVVESTYGVSRGTCFAIDERRLVTAAHVLGESRYAASLHPPKGGKEQLLKVLAIDHKTDVAIIETALPHGMTPLKLAEVAPAAESAVIALGRHSGSGFKTFFPSAGKFKGEMTVDAVISARVREMTTAELLTAELKAMSFRMFRSPSKGDGSEVATFAAVPMKPGMSGGPLIDAKTFEVVGVNSYGILNVISGFGGPRDVRALMQTHGISLIPKTLKSGAS